MTDQTEFNWQELAYTLFEEAGDALFLFDPEKEQLLDVNPMAQRLSGLSRRELLQMKVTYLFRSEVPGGLNRLRQAFRRTGLFHSQEGFWLRQQNESAWIPVNLTITRLHAELRTLGLITARDVREQREAHAQLKKIESELRRLTSSVSDCLWSAEIDRAGRWAYSYISPVAERLTGRPADYFLPGPERWLNAVHPEDRPMVEKAFARLKTGQSSSMEYRLLWPDGSFRWLRDSVMATPGSNGSRLSLHGVVSDITERKLTYEALRKSESRQRVLLEEMPAILWTTDADLCITSTMGAGLAHLGLRPGDIVGLQLSEYLGTDDPEDPMLAMHQRVLAGESVSQEIVWQGRTFQSHVEPLRGEDEMVVGCIGVALDITERKAVEEALQESQRALLTLLSNLPGMAYRCLNDPDWTLEFASEGCFELTGYHPEEMIGNAKVSYAQIIHPDDRGPVWDEVQRALGEGQPFQLLYRIITAGGEEKWVWEQGRGIFTAEGELLALEGFVTDITQRMRAEEALRASEAKHRSLIENLTQSVFLKDRGLRYIAVNELFCQSLGCTEDEILGKRDADLFPEYLAEKYDADDRSILTKGERLEYEEPISLNGKVRTMHTVKSPVRDENGRIAGVLGILWDVTEQRQLETQFRQAQKMDAIGKLAGGIAHDFNNLLTAILGNLELILAELDRDHPYRELLDNSIKAGFRGADLIRQLLSFARQTPLRLVLLDLNASIEETMKLLRRTIDPRITVRMQLDPDLGGVQADAVQVGQVLMNLCLNARDAMPDGGELTIETANVTLDKAGAAAFLDGRAGEFVRLSVSDTGQGIPLEIQERLFEPFFTTKGPGKGTGLGLATVFGIVKQHEGWIKCQSAPGQGARFDIYLPRCMVPTASVSDVPADDVRGGRETILLASDHDMVCRLGKDILERYGYRVLTVSAGDEAVEIYRGHRHEIDLVLLDLTLPRLSGSDTLRALRKINPAARVLVSSGYHTEEAIQIMEREGAAGFIAKPYRPAELARSVRSALDRTRGEGRGTRDEGRGMRNEG